MRSCPYGWRMRRLPIIDDLDRYSWPDFPQIAPDGRPISLPQSDARLKEYVLYINARGSQVCGAQKPNGEICRSKPIGRGRCRLHNGTESPRVGRARPAMVRDPNKDLGALERTRYGNYLPKDLAKLYFEERQNEDYVSRRDEISVLVSMLKQKMEGLSEGGTSAQWKLAREQAFELKNSMTDGVGTEAALKRLIQTLTDGTVMIAKEEDIRSIMMDLNQLTKTEILLAEKQSQFLTATQVMNLLAQVIAVIRYHVADERILAQISASIAGLVSQGIGPRVTNEG